MSNQTVRGQRRQVDRRESVASSAWCIVAVSACAVLLATVLAACGSDTGHRPGVPSATPARTSGSGSVRSAAGVARSGTTPARAPAPLPVAPVTWTPCGSDLQCGSVAVPLAYAKPEGATIQIALERHPAEDPAARIGSLVFDPGGPGASGIDAMSEVLAILPVAVLDRFDIVAFDPRGVGRSDPVSCGPATSTSTGPLPDPVPQTAAARLVLLGSDQAFAAACARSSGPLLAHVGTVDAARDLDRIRAALGDRRLSYIGFSYGTLLGAVYAELFPTHVRAMVLDGAIDPALSTDAMTLDQAEGFEASLERFFSWCATTATCPWRPAGDPTSALLAAIAASRSAPVPAGAGRSAGPGAIYDALLDGLYAPSFYPELGNVLGALATGDGGPILAMSDAYVANGSPNGAAAGAAIDCLDHPVTRDLAAYQALAASDGARAPVFGPLLAWGELGCAVWPVPPTRTPGPVVAAGSPPIVVVGTTGDPATPYAWAVAIAGQLRHGALVTWQGTSHVATYYSSCVRSIEAAYLTQLTVPGAGTTCTD
ncbi:MAG: alpha/beta hydrolase [Actinomycetota bacterium]|nr:alpha/beta hydrolase [Actinomycetota bacterium]